MFNRLEKIIGNENIEKLHANSVAIIGIGGVGGNAVETLVRNGIENIIIVDNDTVDITNKNRQLIALDSTLDNYKVDIMKERIHDINNNCKVTIIKEFINEENINELFEYKFDYLIDSCDTVSTKILLIIECLNRNIKFVSSMGTGNKFEPKKLEITEIRKTSYDPLAKIIRKKLKDNHINDKVMVLSSTEKPIKLSDRTPGSYSVVPNTAGILIADYILKDILNYNVQKM